MALYWSLQITIQNENYFLDILSKVLSKQTCLYKNVILIEDLENRKQQKIIGVTIDNKLNFKSHISELCKRGFSKHCSFI